ncbi:MAG TPA: PAS domain-containing protein [Methanolinea sp.]|nr:PAS domain-containing protein [Methanolinea sp.]
MEREDLHEIFERIQTGIVIIDPLDHTILDVNPNAAALMGHKRDKVVGRICHQFICPAEKGRCPITDLGQEIDNAERVLINRDGEKVPILKTATKARLGEKEVIIESFIDNRDRKIAEERRCAMIGYIDETVMRIREPLLLVKQNLEDLAGRVDDIPAGSGILQAELQVEAQRLAQIFENLLDIQRAIAEGREEIPESYKAFITRE